MKKTQQILTTIIILILLTFFAETSWADVCVGDYIIDDSDTSGDLAALSGCTEIIGSLTIVDTNKLYSLRSLDNLTSLSGDLSISNCDILNSLNGLHNLTSVSGNLSISSNDYYTNLTGLESLTSVGGDLYIGYHGSLTSLAGLNNINTIGGDLYIEDNDAALTSLNGLNNLTSVGGVFILANDALTSLNGLEGVTSVSGDLSINGNRNLASLSALSNITSVGGSLTIATNREVTGSLTSLSGLENITSVGGSLAIAVNNALTNLCALYDVNLEGDQLYIFYNDSLSMETAYALETQLRNNGFTGSAEIYDNYGSELVPCDDCLDIDDDGVCDDVDNCPNICNSDQFDADSDSEGDVCDDTPGCESCGGDPCELPCSTLQASSVMTDHNWKPVILPYSTASPVVIAGPPTDNGPAPGVVRLRNVTDTSFAVRFQEWQYIDDGYHNPENVPYLVISEGRHVMNDGSIWEAGTLNMSGTGSWTSKSFTQSFSSEPALFLTAQTYNGEQPITVRARNVTSTGFEAALFEEEVLMDGHVEETIGYLAIYSSPSEGTVKSGDTDVSYYLEDISVTHQFVSVLGSSIKMEEEQSFDDEVSHVNAEMVNVLKLGDQIFAQDITANGSDPAAIRRLGP